MRILVHEFVSGGGLAGRDVARSLAREGAAMLAALVADLAAIREHDIVATADPRFPLAAPPGVEVVTLCTADVARLDRLIASADAVWLIAPEADRSLERLAARVERHGKALLGPRPAVIRLASDKAGLARRLVHHGIPHPKTCVLRNVADSVDVARGIGFPVVVKPARGAGCGGVCLARNARELRRAVDIVRQAHRRGSLLLQRYVPGSAASVSMLADGRQSVPLTVNAQSVRASRSAARGTRGAVPWRPFSYHGGRTPFEHRLAERAVEAAIATCRAVPGLRGYVGVDLVLTASDAVVIEVNPRLTTAYLGVRRAIAENVAALALAACAGTLPARPVVRHSVRFTTTGRVFCEPTRASVGPVRRSS